jgi:hypothetical protein
MPVVRQVLDCASPLALLTCWGVLVANAGTGAVQDPGAQLQSPYVDCYNINGESPRRPWAQAARRFLAVISWDRKPFVDRRE